MSMDRPLWLVLPVMLLLCWHSYGATIKVGEGEKLNTPHEAVAIAAAGDTIVIGEGTYQFSDAISLFGLEEITIIGTGDVQLWCDNMNDNVFWISGCRGVTVQNVRARHTNPAKDERCYGNVFGIDSSDDIFITNCEIHGCGAIGVYVYNSDRVELRDNHIHDNWLWAVQFEGEGLNGEHHGIDGLTMEANILECNGCQEGAVYGEGFTIGSFIGVEDPDSIYFFFECDEQGDTLRFLVSGECENCFPLLQDPDEYRGATMEVEWDEVGIVFPGTEECGRIKRIRSILVLD